MILHGGNALKVEPHYLVALIIAAILAILLTTHIAGIAWRDIRYHAVLKTYSSALKPGMKRREVENYFVTSKYVSFSRGASQDIVEIAHEKAG